LIKFDTLAVSKTDIQMVARHVREGHGIVRRQEALIDKIRRSGRDTAESEQLLRTFKDIQRLHEQHLQRLIANRI